VLGELLFAPGKWLPMPEALRRLKSKFGAKAAAKLLGPIRSGALPTALRRVRLRDGFPVSHLTSHYPAPAWWNDVGPEDVKIPEKGPWQAGDAGDDRTFILHYAFVDLQCFNAIFFAKKAERPPTLLRRMIIHILGAEFPDGFSADDISHKATIVRDHWQAECRAPLGNARSPVKYLVPSPKTVRRTINDFLTRPEAYSD
jgi:hypothetical protein